MAPDSGLVACAFVPPYITERLADQADPAARRRGLGDLEAGATARAMRALLSTLPAWAATPSPRRGRYRLVYDAEGRGIEALPGRLVREEGQPSRQPRDPAVEEAYAHAGRVYAFYHRHFNRDSLDGRGMALISSVHVGQRLNNAFWTGEQMAYGDGDGVIFVRFTRGLDVVGHELTHGVVAHATRLVYQGEPGAIHEHLADVFGILTVQWAARQTAGEASWLVGERIMGPSVRARAIRTFAEGPAYENDPILGTDPQPKHRRQQYTGSGNRGGVHLNAGILNHAFYRAAMARRREYAWTRLGAIWYQALARLTPEASFEAFAQATTRTAAELYGVGSRDQRIVEAAWTAVGF